MSEAARSAIAAAANRGGVDVSSYFRQTTKAGDGMVRLDRITYPDRFGGIATWQVLIVLPAAIADAEKFLEALVPDVVAELRAEGTVRAVIPQELQLTTGRLPVVVIELTREEE